MAKNTRSGVKVTCSECGHDATIGAPADTWVCNCAAGVGPDDCDCDAVNVEPEAVEDNPPDTAGEVAALEARLADLRGQIKAAGGSTNKGDQG